MRLETTGKDLHTAIDAAKKRDQNGRPIHRDIRQNTVDGLWYTNVWSGSQYVTNVRRYGYLTRAEAKDGDISDFDAASYREPEEAWTQDRAICPECEGRNLTIDLPNMRCRDCDPDPEHEVPHGV